MALYSIDAVVKYGETPADLANVQDVRWSIEGTEVDISTRDTAPWGATGVSMLRGSGEIDLLYAPADVGYIALKDALLDRTPIDLQFLDAATSGKGISGPFAVTNMSKGEELEDKQVVTFTVKAAGEITEV